MTMDTRTLERFAQAARRSLQEQVGARLERVLRAGSLAQRERPQAVAELQAQIAASSRAAVVERVAYTWFNRFCALRFMDVNHYTRIGVVSPAAGFTQPEILQEAKQGHIDADLPLNPQAVFDLLQGRTAVPDPQQEAYRLLLVATCNQLHRAMPFLFEPIADYTELLMPADLLSAGSLLQAVRDALTPAACESVEVIGWLYQFYISEKKDAVMRSKKKIAPEDIPAATQLFTPHWIVRYMVENSLGRLWLLNRPQSRLAQRMEFYVAPEQPETDFLRIDGPEALRLCDPAAGSGHILVYAFDLLYAMYAEEGYSAPEIPRLILEHNLVGLEIDERAAALAAFALVMKARARDRRFLQRGVAPHICVLRKIALSARELDAAVEQLLPLLAGDWQAGASQMALLDLGPQQLGLEASGERQRLREALRHDLDLFREADNVGSLLRPRLAAVELRRLREREAAQAAQLNWLDRAQREKVERVLLQAEFLARQYDVVVANPPYMGGKGMNAELKKFLAENYKDVKSDVFAAFIVRNLELARPKGQLGFMTPFVWMFISSYEKLRKFLINKKTITTLVQLEYSGFDGATVPICTFTLENAHRPAFKGGYVRLSDFRGSENQAPKTLEAIRDPECGWFYRATAVDFKKIPGAPIAYWVSGRVRNIFEVCRPLGDLAPARKGVATSDNNRFLRFWWEVSYQAIFFQAKTSEDARSSGCKWFPLNKGGQFRKWFGNQEYVINWENDGEEIKETVAKKYPYLKGNVNFVVHDDGFYFKPSVSFSEITSSSNAFRFYPAGFVYNNKGPSIFPDTDCTVEQLIAYCNSIIVSELMKVLNPTITFNLGNFNSLPAAILPHDDVFAPCNKLISIAKEDWESFEVAWGFKTSPVLDRDARQVDKSYNASRAAWDAITKESHQIEEDVNLRHLQTYELQEEFESRIPLGEVTLTCNPYYRYGNEKSEEELEALLLADTMREFISYAVGCMFGRYSLDRPGLILANQGETLADFLRQVGLPAEQVQFLPDADNVIPMLDGNWFNDDIVERFKRFLRVTFGDTHYAANVAFIEQALGRDLRSYFLRDFYDHHVRMYKKRPIYWLFSSPRGSFNALIYMHRYRPDTLSVVLNDYLREFRVKLAARRQHLQGVSQSPTAAQRERTAALREIDGLDRTLAELRAYEDDILYPLATRQLDIDLDDGVLVNYQKFGQALKRVPGLS